MATFVVPILITEVMSGLWSVSMACPCCDENHLLAACYASAVEAWQAAGEQLEQALSEQGEDEAWN